MSKIIKHISQISAIGAIIAIAVVIFWQYKPTEIVTEIVVDSNQVEATADTNTVIAEETEPELLDDLFPELKSTDEVVAVEVEPAVNEPEVQEENNIEEDIIDNIIDEEPAETISVHLSADGGGVSYQADIAIDPGVTVEELMTVASSTNGFKYTATDYGDLGRLVESIGGITNSADKGLFWKYKVNGKYAGLGISALILEDGDIVSWHYEQE